MLIPSLNVGASPWQMFYESNGFNYCFQYHCILLNEFCLLNTWFENDQLTKIVHGFHIFLPVIKVEDARYLET